MAPKDFRSGSLHRKAMSVDMGDVDVIAMIKPDPPSYNDFWRRMKSNVKDHVFTKAKNTDDEGCTPGCLPIPSFKTPHFRISPSQVQEYDSQVTNGSSPAADTPNSAASLPPFSFTRRSSPGGNSRKGSPIGSPFGGSQKGSPGGSGRRGSPGMYPGRQGIGRGSSNEGTDASARASVPEAPNKVVESSPAPEGPNSMLKLDDVWRKLQAQEKENLWANSIKFKPSHSATPPRPTSNLSQPLNRRQLLKSQSLNPSTMKSALRREGSGPGPNSGKLPPKLSWKDEDGNGNLEEFIPTLRKTQSLTLDLKAGGRTISGVSSLEGSEEGGHVPEAEEEEEEFGGLEEEVKWPLSPQKIVRAVGVGKMQHKVTYIVNGGKLTQV